MAKTKSKSKKSSKKPTTTTGHSTNSKNGDKSGQAESIRKKPKIPFEVNEANELRQHTLDELISLTRATDEWTDAVKDFCSSRLIICLFGSRKRRPNCTKTEHDVTIDLVFDEQKMREEKMIQLAQDVIALCSSLHSICVFYHPPLNHFFPLLIEQIITKSELKLRMLSLINAPLEPKCKTKWWTTLSSVPDLRRVILYEPGQLPPIIYEHANRLSQVRVARITRFDWDLVPLFKQFGSSLVALELELNTRINCDLDELDRLLEKNARIGANLRKLHLNYQEMLANSGEEQSKLLRIIVKHFPKLEVLNIKALAMVHLEEIMNEITKLPKLEELCMVALLISELIPKRIDHLAPNTTVVRLRIYNPVDDLFDEFGRIIVPLFPSLKWIHFSTSWTSNADQFVAQMSVWYPSDDSQQRTKFQIKWYDSESDKGQLFGEEESPMDEPNDWTDSMGD